MASSSTRNRFRTGAVPLRVNPLVDPFAAMVSKMKMDLQRLNDEKALSALAQGNPDEFLKYAQTTMAKRTGEDKQLWESLVVKAENKIDEDKWAALTKDNPAKLDDFYAHLQGKLDSAALGSDAAYSIINTMSSVKKAITARDENAQDQKALSEYVNTNDHTTYAKYLTEKLSRTTDPAVAAKLQSNIEELKNRQNTADRVERTQLRLKIASEYLNGGSATSAIVKLQDLALKKGVTPEEVSAIQTLVTQIHDREEANARRAASSSGSSLGVDVPAFQKNLADYQETRAQVDQAIKDGKDPNTILVGKDGTTLIDKLRGAASILEGQYSTASQYAAANGKLSESQTYQTYASGIETHLGGLPGQIDNMKIQQNVKTTADDFQRTLASNQDPQGRANALLRRISTLSGVAQMLNTTGALNTVQSEILELGAQARQNANLLMSRSNLTTSQKEQLDMAYQEYRQLAENQGVGPDGKPMGQAVDKRSWMEAIDSLSKTIDKNPEDSVRSFAAKTGLKLDDMFGIGLLGQDTTHFRGSDANAPESLKKLVELLKESGVLDYQNKAEDIWKQLLETPGAVPFGPPGSKEYEQMGLTSMDVLEMRRGAGIIKNSGRPPQAGIGANSAMVAGVSTDIPNNGPDLVSYEDSEQELRQEIQKARLMEKKFRQEQMPSIEDSVTDPYINSPFLTSGLEGLMEQYDVALQSQIGPQDAGGPQLTTGSYEDSSTPLELPGFSMPDMPENTPVLSSPQSPDAQDRNGSYDSGPDGIDLQSPIKDGNMF